MPANHAVLSAHLIAFAASIAGGFVSLWRQKQRGMPFHWGNWLVELAISCFVGCMAFWISDSVLEYPEALSAAFAGLAGNLGSQTFDILKAILLRRFGVADLPNDRK